MKNRSQVGMYGWMAAVTFLIFDRELGKGDPVFWFMMQIAMLAGFLTSYPVNWWLVRWRQGDDVRRGSSAPLWRPADVAFGRTLETGDPNAPPMPGGCETARADASRAALKFRSKFSHRFWPCERRGRGETAWVDTTICGAGSRGRWSSSPTSTPCEPHVRISCMVTARGSPCVETALCADHDTPTTRSRVEAEARERGMKDAVRWVDDGGEELLTCTTCGIRSDGTEDEGPFDE